MALEVPMTSPQRVEDTSSAQLREKYQGTKAHPEGSGAASFEGLTPKSTLSKDLAESEVALCLFHIRFKAPIFLPRTHRPT